MDWEVVKGNWAIIWALFMSGVNLIQLLLAKTYVKREELELVRNRLQGLENNLRGDLRELAPSIRQVSRISDLLLENELKDK